MQMTTEDIVKAYEEQVAEEVADIQRKDEQIKVMAESRKKSLDRKEKIEEIKSKILERRKLVKEKAEVDAKVKKTIKEDDEKELSDEDEDEVEIEVEDDEDLDVEDEVEDEDKDEDVAEEAEEEEPVQKESKKQNILKKIVERKRADILKKIQERKEAAEKAQPVKEKKEVRVGTLLEAVEGDKKRRFQVYREETTHFFLRELGTKKAFKIAKEKVELE